jgi:hypothetical protein
VLHAAAPLGAAWVGGRRNAYRRFSAPIPPGARRRLDGWFDRSFLERAEIARVARIRGALPESLARLAPTGMLDLSTVRGMAFIDTIVIAEANARGADDEASLIFHELVHLVQCQLLGTVGFVRAYLLGWLDAGRSYFDNPLEAMAFELQARFDAGDVCNVASEVSRAFR